MEAPTPTIFQWKNCASRILRLRAGALFFSRSRAPPRGVSRVGRSRASRRADAHGFGKRRPRAATFGEALQDLLPAPLSGEPECDPAVEIDPLEGNERRIALRPPRIGQVLLRRVRDGARPQEEGEPARPDNGRCQRWAPRLRAQATGSNARTTTAPHVHVIQTRSPSTPSSRSPQRRCSRKKA